jgi:plasmid stabilization system protein ParE
MMPHGDKSKYTGKQERKADHIAESHESRGVPEKAAERRAGATVIEESGGGKKSGSGRDQSESHASSQKGGRLGGQASARRPATERSAAFKRAAATLKRIASS